MKKLQATIVQLTALLMPLAPLAAHAASEMESFQSPPASTRTDACANATEKAKLWLKANTEPGNPTAQYNQVRRGWAAQAGGISKCECEKTGETWRCAVDAELVSK